MKIPCRKCLEFGDHTGDINKTIDEYINSLDEENRADNSIYETRLSICEVCDSLQNGICRYCGCFVVARAAKKTQFCPYPQNKKW